MDTQRQPQPGDLYFIPDKEGRWALALRFVRLHDGNATVGEFHDEAGDTYVCSLSELQTARVAAGDDAADDPADAIARAERQRYRRRSRVTAQQRANHKLTAKQRVYIFTLGRRLGFNADDLRAMTPRGSISALSVREASDLIDRLNGRPVGPQRSVAGMGA